MLTLGKPTDEHFRQEILELAEDLSRRAALALDNARLYSERTAISQALQRSLLPPELPEIPGVEVEVIYRAAGEGNEVGGDFYDLFPIRDGARASPSATSAARARRPPRSPAWPGTPCACWPARASAAPPCWNASTPPSSTRAPAAASSPSSTASCGPSRTAAPS